jgi:integrase
MATIRERRPGVFEVRAIVGRDEAGRPVQVSRTVRGTKRDARRVADQLATTTSSAKGARTTIAELLDAWLETMDGSWAPSTSENQRSRVALVKQDRIAQVTLAKLTAPEVAAWHTRLARRGAGEGSVRNQHLVLRAALSLALRWGWVPLSAAASAPLGRRKRAPRGVLGTDEVKAVLAAGASMAAEGRLEPAAPVALRLACVSGARRSELAALRWEELDGTRLVIDSSIAVIRSGTADEARQPVLRDDPTKTGTRRVVSLDEATRAALQALSEHPGMLGPWILAPGSRPISPDRISAWWRRARDRAGLDARWRLHDLRHWSATTTVAAGHDVPSVAARLGHSNPAMTLRVYAHAIEATDATLATTLGAALEEVVPHQGPPEGPEALA